MEIGEAFGGQIFVDANLDLFIMFFHNLNLFFLFHAGDVFLSSIQHGWSLWKLS